MPWKESDVTMERTDFIRRLNNGERMTDLCKEYGISRKTGYKYLDRYKRYGSGGLFDQSRRPDLLARKTSASIEKLIVDLRKERPTWGAAKIAEYLRKAHAELKIPARSTIHQILDSHGLITRRKRKRFKAWPTELKEAIEPNNLWCADYKGQFRLGNKKYCFPLTITDQASRYIIACESLTDTTFENARPIFQETFEEYGLPDAIRTDNGSPFSSRGLMGLSKLAVWWMKLGIRPERIEPGKPQQNGRHERMHLTLKQETTRPSGLNEMQQQEKFDLFRKDFNENRPHQGLGMVTPSSKYQLSKRKMPTVVEEPDYPDCDITCYVNKSGKIFIPSVGNCNISTILKGEYVGIRQEDEELWSVHFVDLNLGVFDSKEGVFHSNDGKVK